MFFLFTLINYQMKKKINIQSLYLKFQSAALEEYNKQLYNELKTKYDSIIELEESVLRNEINSAVYLDQIKEFLNKDDQVIPNEDSRIFLKSIKAFLAMKAQFISRSNSISSYEEYFNQYLIANPLDKSIQSDKQSMINILQKDQAITELFHNEDDSISSSIIKNTIRLTCVAFSVLIGYYIYKRYSGSNKH